MWVQPPKLWCIPQVWNLEAELEDERKQPSMARTTQNKLEMDLKGKKSYLTKIFRIETSGRRITKEMCPAV